VSTPTYASSAPSAACCSTCTHAAAKVTTPAVVAVVAYGSTYYGMLQHLQAGRLARRQAVVAATQYRAQELHLLRLRVRLRVRRAGAPPA
jgi:hypothetical protein